MADYSITWAQTPTSTGQLIWVADVELKRGDQSRWWHLVTPFTEKAAAEAYILRKIPEVRSRLWSQSDNMSKTH